MRPLVSQIRLKTEACVVLKCTIFFNLLMLTKSCNFFFFSFFFYFNVSLSEQAIELHRIIDNIISLEKYLCKCQLFQTNFAVAQIISKKLYAYLRHMCNKCTLKHILRSSCERVYRLCYNQTDSFCVNVKLGVTENELLFFLYVVTLCNLHAPTSAVHYISSYITYLPTWRHFENSRQTEHEIMN